MFKTKEQAKRYQASANRKEQGETLLIPTLLGFKESVVMIKETMYKDKPFINPYL